MSFYDNYSSRGKVTAVGKGIISRFNNLVYKNINELVSKSKDPKILEIGGGKGSFAQLLKSKGYDYVGIEPNSKLAKQLSKFGKVYEQLTPPVDIKDKNFDVIYFSNVIEHIPQHLAFDLLIDLHKYLKEDGYIVVISPNYLDMKKFFWDCDYTHIFPLTLRRFNQIMGDSEYDIKRIVKSRAGYTGFIKFLISFIHNLLGYILSTKIIKSEKLYKAYLTTTEQINVYAKKLT